MTYEAVADWLARYVNAWLTYDEVAIRRLFSEDAAYHYSPFGETDYGRGAIVASWMDDRDAPGTYEATYQPIVVDGDRAVAEGRTRYRDVAGGPFVREFANIFVMRFNENGECTEFREWYMERKLP